MGQRASQLDELVAKTPDTRDRYVDFLRAASILTVVLGHWFIGVIWWRNGKIGTVSAIGLTSWLWLATWFLQVIPLFFFVGGFSNLTSYRSYKRRGRSTRSFLWSRAQRLLKPSLVLIAVWFLPELIMHLIDTGGSGWLRGVLPPGATVPFGPLWFLAVYLIVVMVSPIMIRLHERFGWAVPWALAVGAIAVDVVRFGFDHPGIGFANVWLVFLFPHQLGFFYADGRLTQLPKRVFVAMGVVGFGTMMVLSNLYRFFPDSSVYPRSLLGTDVEKITNTNPPTLMMLAMGVWSIGAAMLLRPYASAWLRRVSVWKAVIYLNTVVMTLFLWHMTAYLLGVLTLWPLGLGDEGDTNTSWWIQRPIWLIVPAVYLAVIVAIVGRFERPTRSPST